jgi:hypothetical protein
VNKSNAHPGPAKLRVHAVVVPLLVAIYGCSGSIGGGPGDPAEGNGGSTSTGGTKSSSAGKSGSSGNGSSGTSFGNAGSGGSSPVLESGKARPVSMEGAPLYSRFVRLTNQQWENSVRDILRLSEATGLSEAFIEPVAGVTDFDNNERVVIVDSGVWTDFQLAAETVANQVTATDDALQAVVQGTDVGNFIRTLGRRAFRRDLTQAEVTSYTALHTEGSTAEGSQSAFTKGANWVIAALLQSPHFLYRAEMGDDGAPLSGYEMAAKLSLWLRNTTPSDALLDDAEGGSLDSAEGAATAATTMLGEPAAAEVMQKFHGDLYRLGLYDNVSKDGVQGYTTALNAEFKEASQQFFAHIFSQDLGVRDILTSHVAFAGSGMARLYGVTLQGSGMQQVNLPDRSGYYMQVPFLSLWAINNEPHSIQRGVRVNLDTLCADPGVPALELPMIPPLEPMQTNRARITALTAGCAAICHGEIINPVGFAFEDFDGLGRVRETDNGQAIDSSGSYPFAEGILPFTGATELMELIADGEQAHRCYAKKLASFATSRDFVEGERPVVEELGAVSQATGASLKDVMLALVKNAAFRTHVGGAP